MSRAGRAWRAGDIPTAYELADDPKLRFLTRYVCGRYAEALADVPRGRRYAALAEQARRHLRPLPTRLDRDTAIPYADHPLAPYLPTVPARIDGREVTVHLDTGGTHLVMGTQRAAALGMTLTPAGRSSHGHRRATLHTGLVRELTLGAAQLDNVPVQALSTLTGPQDVIVIGTNVLQHFQATIDHPGRRLVLRPRGAALPNGVRVPFYLWADHFLFARGGFGERRDLTWFVDSGFIHVDGDRQAAVIARPGRGWGAGPLRLGPLEEDAPLVAKAPRRVPWSSFGGIRIDGLLTNALPGRHVWTIDFDARTFVFSSAGRPV